MNPRRLHSATSLSIKFASGMQCSSQQNYNNAANHRADYRGVARGRADDRNIRGQKYAEWSRKQETHFSARHFPVNILHMQTPIMRSDNNTNRGFSRLTNTRLFTSTFAGVAW